MSMQTQYLYTCNRCKKEQLVPWGEIILVAKWRKFTLEVAPYHRSQIDLCPDCLTEVGLALPDTPEIAKEKTESAIDKLLAALKELVTEQVTAEIGNR